MSKARMQKHVAYKLPYLKTSRFKRPKRTILKKSLPDHGGIQCDKTKSVDNQKMFNGRRKNRYLRIRLVIQKIIIFIAIFFHRNIRFLMIKSNCIDIGIVPIFSGADPGSIRKGNDEKRGVISFTSFSVIKTP